VYYAFAIIWPQMVNSLYANSRQMWAGCFAVVVGAGITAREIISGFDTKKNPHWLTCFAFLSGSIFLATMATCNPDTLVQAVVLLLLGTILVGANECLISTVGRFSKKQS
jgi:hypothetical protein